MAPVEPTGRSFRLRTRSGRADAEIVQVGAALRGLRVDGLELVPQYPRSMPTPWACGIVLVPWPNRVRDGRWTQRDQTRQLAITEPALSNASHGLARFASYQPDSVTEDAVTLRAPVVPQTGYPFHLDTTVTYVVDDGGLTVTHAITNIGAEEAPVAVGAHPYVQIGDDDVADLTLTLDATARFVVDERMLPVGEAPVDETTDLRSARRLGDLSLDTAYAGIARDAGDRIRATLHRPDGRSLDLWAGPGFEYLQVFTTERFPGHPFAVAVEPMTAPADAFNSGRSLRWLSPGGTWTLEWGIALH